MSPMHSRTAIPISHLHPSPWPSRITACLPWLPKGHKVPRVVGTKGPWDFLLFVNCAIPLQPPWCMSASLKRSFLYSGHGKKSHGWQRRKRSIPLSVYCYILLWPIPTNPKRLPLPKIIATRFRVNQMPRRLERTQEEESLRICGWCEGGISMELRSMASV
jgi:hypothetical protein